MTQDGHSQSSQGSEREAGGAYVTLVLDETGSMQACKGAAIAGFNEYLNRLRQSPTPVRFTLTLFNSSKLEVRHHHEALAQVAALTEDTYQPEASTPLYDAIGQTLAAAGHAAPPDSKKLCVILTDGLENASREYTRDGIARMIKEYEGRGWTFVYLGADHDAWAAGGDLGFSGDNTISFCQSDLGPTFDRLAESTITFLSSRPGRQTQPFWQAADLAPSDPTDPDETAGRPERGEAHP